MTSILNQYIDIDAFADPVIREKSAWESEKEAIEAMKAAGMEDLPREIRFNSTDQHPVFNRFGKDKRCWYIAYMFGNLPVVHWGDFSDNTRNGSFRGSFYQELDENRRRELEEIQRVHRKAVEQETERVQREAAERAVSEWEDGLDADPATQTYLDRKNLKDSFGARINARGDLILPVYGSDGAIMSIQTIGATRKTFLKDGRTKGGFWWIGNPKAQSVYLCEGFATGASIHEATGKTVYISFSANNLSAVARMLASWGRNVVIIADNDKSGTGAREAEKAAKLTGCRWWMVPNDGNESVTDANDYQSEFGNLEAIIPSLDGGSTGLHLLMANDLIGRPHPIRWLLKGWIPQRSVGMVHGPSGGGKTNFVMDIACTLSTASLDRDNPTRWADGRRCRRSNIVYLCGEGFEGLIGRLNAWMKMHDKGDIGNLAIINHPLDLDAPGGVDSVIAAIQESSRLDRIDMLIIDTVNRYMSGDENSAQDTRTFLNYTGRLQETFDCTILYVHHTGNDEANINRGRGSSAWRGALDFEISVTKDEESKLRKAMPVKMKDGELREPIFGDIVGVKLGEGWDDPDEPDEPYTAPIWQYISEDQTPQPNRGKWDGEIIDAFVAEGRWVKAKGKFLIQMEDWRNYLKETMEMGTKAASDYLRGKTGPIKDAVEKRMLEATSTGWWLHDKWIQEQVIVGKSQPDGSEGFGD